MGDSDGGLEKSERYGVIDKGEESRLPTPATSKKRAPKIRLIPVSLKNCCSTMKQYNLGLWRGLRMEKASQDPIDSIPLYTSKNRQEITGLRLDYHVEWGSNRRNNVILPDL